MFFSGNPFQAEVPLNGEKERGCPEDGPVIVKRLYRGTPGTTFFYEALLPDRCKSDSSKLSVTCDKVHRNELTAKSFRMIFKRNTASREMNIVRYPRWLSGASCFSKSSSAAFRKYSESRSDLSKYLFMTNPSYNILSCAVSSSGCRAPPSLASS